MVWSTSASATSRTSTSSSRQSEVRDRRVRRRRVAALHRHGRLRRYGQIFRGHPRCGAVPPQARLQRGDGLQDGDVPPRGRDGARHRHDDGHRGDRRLATVDRALRGSNRNAFYRTSAEICSFFANFLAGAVFFNPNLYAPVTRGRTARSPEAEPPALLSAMWFFGGSGRHRLRLRIIRIENELHGYNGIRL